MIKLKKEFQPDYLMRACSTKVRMQEEQPLSPPFIKPECELTNKNGNVFNIIGLVKRALERAGYPEKAQEFQHKAMHDCRSYDEVLILLHSYVDAY